MASTSSIDERNGYPRPDFDRSEHWRSLDGEWDFARGDVAGKEDLLSPDFAYPESIVVPFPWESQRSEVGAQWLSRGWYRRTVVVPEEWLGQQIILHFGGVYERATVYLNGHPAGQHIGGSGGFEVDITGALTPGEQVVVVCVDAPVDKSRSCHGKQRTIPAGDYDNCSFTPSSGIWQSVWLEPRPAVYVASLRLRAADGFDALLVDLQIIGAERDGALATVSVAGQEGVLEAKVPEDGTLSLKWKLKSLHRWSPEDPYLYYVTVSVTSAGGQDRVTSYTGLRRLELIGDQLFLNGERLYLRGVLDQGYWPDSGLTAPTRDHLVLDLQLARKAGYNLVRKHLKLEDPRWLYEADRMGMLVWSEPPSISQYSEEAADKFLSEIRRMVQRDANHPSIIVWGLYNEEWGLHWSVEQSVEFQARLREAASLIRLLDDSRPFVDNSGWSHVETDIVDWHYYESDMSKWKRNVQLLVEAADAVIPVALRPPQIEHKRLCVNRGLSGGRPMVASEYGAGLTSFDRGWYLKWQTQELRRYDGLAGYVYTELCDVEYESFGIYDGYREMKDLGNVIPSQVNANSVIVFDLVPERPGCDFRVSSRIVAVDVRVSHHGRAPLVCQLRSAWGTHCGVAPTDFHGSNSTLQGGTFEVEPFAVSGARPITAELPHEALAARLHVAAVVSETIVAQSFLDVVREPTSSGWRP